MTDSPLLHDRGDPQAAPAQLLRWLVAAFCVGSAITLWPLWAPLSFAIWTAGLLQPAVARLTHNKDKGRKRAAAMLTTVIVLVFLVPLALLVISLSAGAAELGHSLLKSPNAKDALKTVFSTGEKSAVGPMRMDLAHIMQVVREHGEQMFTAVNFLASAAIATAFGLVIFVSATYAFLVDGAGLYQWFLKRSPIERRHAERLSTTFMEAGRGLIIGTGLTSVVQGTAAGIGFAIVDIPRAFVFGFLTAFASLIPAVGTMLVWGPLALGLFAFDRPAAAIAVIVIGLVVSSADNVLHPLFSRYGKLKLSFFALFLAMVGGVLAFGAAGLVLGPVLLRMAKEGLDILREEKTGEPTESEPAEEPV